MRTLTNSIGLCLLLFLFLFHVPVNVFAGDVVINEFLVDPDASQWVELYNKSPNPIDISGWVIDDDGGSQKFTIPAGTTINPLELKVFESSLFNLNKTSPDTIQLLNGSSIEDNYHYETGPGENKSYGRIGDGNGDWGVFSSITKGASNSTVTPLPSATPTQVPSPTATDTPVPSKTPIPSKIPTPTRVPTSIPTAKPVATSIPTQKIVSVNSTAKLTQTKEASSSTQLSRAILGEQTASSSATLSATIKSSPKPTKIIKTLDSSKRNIFPVLLIGVGAVFLIGCGILGFVIFKKNNS